MKARLYRCMHNRRCIHVPRVPGSVKNPHNNKISEDLDYLESGCRGTGVFRGPCVGDLGPGPVCISAFYGSVPILVPTPPSPAVSQSVRVGMFAYKLYRTQFRIHAVETCLPVGPFSRLLDWLPSN